MQKRRQKRLSNQFCAYEAKTFPIHWMNQLRSATTYGSCGRTDNEGRESEIDTESNSDGYLTLLLAFKLSFPFINKTTQTSLRDVTSYKALSPTEDPKTSPLPCKLLAKQIRETLIRRFFENGGIRMINNISTSYNITKHNLPLKIRSGWMREPVQKTCKKKQREDRLPRGFSREIEN